MYNSYSNPRKRRPFNRPLGKPQMGCKYNTLRDQRGNIIEYTSWKYPDNYYSDEPIKVEHHFNYSENDRKTTYYNSENQYSLYKYNPNGTVKYHVDGNYATGMYTEHFYDNNGVEQMRRTVGSDNVVKEMNGANTRYYRILFRRVHNRDLGLL